MPCIVFDKLLCIVFDKLKDLLCSTPVLGLAGGPLYIGRVGGIGSIVLLFFFSCFQLRHYARWSTIDRLEGLECLKIRQ